MVKVCADAVVGGEGEILAGKCFHTSCEICKFFIDPVLPVRWRRRYFLQETLTRASLFVTILLYEILVFAESLFCKKR